MARKVIDTSDGDAVAKAKKDRARKRGPFAGIILFLKQVINELKKVVTPTRRELWSYTAVVLVFVIFMMAIVFGLDQLFSWIVIFVFGSPGA